ncbi:type II CRISPR RNA-guided endonuclease Cas9 [Lacrimispora saccharolytica]|uniref:type II CRISPR RNA-guided endonuclease Cas9 n=1 Tax=Lacrimispora saccharolytica TaxID=84030 RepID=UPI00265CF262|nr:type II CRISPR RNA-guided endonuclease Cas9 [Lacrimispora saccharolytica]MCF2656005.1 type II CRISPR RNA-guided endonuclease Cas9 [Lacrimispora saccharolytica]
MGREKIYVGLDIGTNSVGYAVTDSVYNIKKLHGKQAWGTVIFDEASLKDERRVHRSDRRRLDRKKQRVLFIQEFFAKEISKIDPSFYKRIKESSFYGDDSECKFSLFCDGNFTDKEYHDKYPTIHHLIADLMNNDEYHDPRLVYLAVSWLVTHRGHFLSNISLENIDKIKDFYTVYSGLMNFFALEKPWDMEYSEELGEIIKKKTGVNNKYALLNDYLYGGAKPSREISEEFPYSREGIVKLLAGGTYKISELFGKEEYQELGSISLGMNEDKFIEISAVLGDDIELIEALRSVYDWSTLVDILGDYNSISEAKIATYKKHKTDLANLKYIIRKYSSEKYDEVFRDNDGGKYGSYVKGGKGSINLEDFNKAILSIIRNIVPESDDEKIIHKVVEELELRTFLPKQKNTDNRVIPYQLYLFELLKILDNAERYLPFLSEVSDEYSVKEKIISVFRFRIPYFVGPLNDHSDYAWIKRYPGAIGKITPWNFDKVVDLDSSEQEFIRRMTNTCTYLPGEDVLPKCSLLYQKFTVLNEINNISVNGERISVELKQKIYNDLFLKYNKVTKKKIVDYLLANGYIEKGYEELVSGVDTNLTSTLSSYKAFFNLMDSGLLTQNDVETIIERSTYSEDKSRLVIWIGKQYPYLSEKDVKYICGIKLKDFGRLSAKLLNGIEGCDKQTGEVYTVISALWNTQNNLSEIILSDEIFSFKKEIEDYQKDYYLDRKTVLSNRLDDMRISNAVRRPIYRTLAVLKDIEKAFGKPDKIFVEMARGSDGSEKGRRKKSRLEQVLDLYKKCDEEDIRDLKRQLLDMGEYANNKLQSDKLFLFYMQLGKCMYTGKSIKLEEIGTKLYDIDHIFPQSFVTDDSIINNKVLVLSEENGKKSDIYPISSEIRHKMSSIWKYLYEIGAISEIKYKRLVRSTPFTDDEKIGFINRQYVETTQATKAVATIIGEKFPDTEIVYCKARLVSDFRHAFDIYKSRIVNDLHHAVDAYLNVVVGNVYNMRFSKRWFNINQEYSVKPKTIFTHDVKCGNEVIWNTQMLENVKKQAVKSNAHFVKYSYFKHGVFFDQMPVSKNNAKIPIKKGMHTDKYGGYDKPAVMFYIPVRYLQGKKTSILIMSVELLYGKRFLIDKEFAREYSYSRLEYILGKPVDSIEFPMGMRPWKVNTVLSLDGFRVAITGIGNNGKTLLIQGVTQFASNNECTYYLSKLEKLSKKFKNNAKYIYDEEFDIVSKARNLELYDLYLKKYKESIYSKRINKPLEIIENGRTDFEKLSVLEQVDMLLNIHSTFGRSGASGVDLGKIGGSPRCAATSFSANVSNWNKQYKDVRIIDMSPSGLWERQSMNLLEL